MIGGGDRLPLRDRGLIGNTETAALVGADGTIDWWCPGRFDAPAAFYRLLDPAGGALQIAPARWPTRAVGNQTYDQSSNVLRTVMTAGESKLEVVDFMPWVRGRADSRIVRLVIARRGAIDVDINVVPGDAWASPRDVLTWSTGIGFGRTVVTTGVDMSSRVGRMRLEAGDHRVVVIDEKRDRSDQGLTVDGALDLLARTNDGWRRHIAPATVVGPYRDDVARSLLVLKALTYPSGGVVAAPTTSLPEREGGERNWDYRYAWIRDASLAMDGIHDAGLHDEAESFAPWLLRVVENADYPLRPAYAVDGLDVPDEEELALRGRASSQPVRIGNAARDHLQLDFYADLFATMHFDRTGHRHPAMIELWDTFAKGADWLVDAWHLPDRGIWEIRSEPRHLVSSKLGAWYALDRMARLSADRSVLDLSAIHWRQAANEIFEWLHDDAHWDSEEVIDASLLRMAWRGPWPADHERVTMTVDRILERLGNGPHIYRYAPTVDDGLPPGEGAFVACGFWAVCALSAMHRWEEAHERMEALCAFSRPLGLLPEEADPATGDFLGNLPQALSHVALIQAAIALTRGPA